MNKIILMGQTIVFCVVFFTLRYLSIRLYAIFPFDNFSIFSRNFFKHCIQIVIWDEYYGIVNGQIQSIFNGVIALDHNNKSFWPVFSLLLMIYDWNITDMFNIKGYIF